MQNAGANDNNKCTDNNVKENGQIKFHQVVSMADGCEEVMEQETIMKLYEEVFNHTETFIYIYYFIEIYFSSFHPPQIDSICKKS